jgi:hypothetical protein
MTNNDLQAFTVAINRLFLGLSNGKTAPVRDAIDLWFDVLRPWPLDVVTGAITAHLRLPTTGRTLPIPADIVAQIKAAVENDGRPGKDEAWASCVSGNDELQTIVWTAEMSHAWGVCLPLLNERDNIGARMAFLEAYDKAVNQSRARGLPVKWSVSLGKDPERRRGAISQAVSDGKLPASELDALPAPAQVAGLLELAKEKGCPESVRAKLLEKRKMFELSAVAEQKPLAKPFKAPTAVPWKQ